MTLKVCRESVCEETLEYRWLLALTRHPATGLGPRRGRPLPHSRDWGIPAAGPGCRWHPNPGPGREPAEGAAWRSAHTEAGTHRSGSWSTCTARPPWRPRAPRLPGPPRGHRTGLTSRARGRGHRDSRGAPASARGSAPASGAVGVD